MIGTNELVRVYNDGNAELNVEFKVIDGEVYAETLIVWQIVRN